MKITVLETFTFDGKAPPFNILGHWGCAFSLCPKGGRVVPGDMAHKIQIDEDVDLIHPNCFVDMKKELEKQSIAFTISDKTKKPTKICSGPGCTFASGVGVTHGPNCPEAQKR